MARRGYRAGRRNGRSANMRLICCLLGAGISAVVVLTIALVVWPRTTSTTTAAANFASVARTTHQSVSPVIIGGAGYSAVAFAKELSTHGVDFALIEATDHVGGRMVQKEVGVNPATSEPYRLEAGANWVQGLNGNPVWGEAIRFGLSGAPQNFDDITYYRADGTPDPANALYNRGSACEREFVAYAEAEALSSRCLQPGEDSNPPKNQDERVCGSILGSPFAYQDDDDRSNDEAQRLSSVAFDPTTDPEPAEARACDVYSQDFEWAEFPNATSANNTLPPNTYTDFRDADYWSGGDKRGYAWLVQSLAAEFIATSENNNIRKVFDDPMHLRMKRKVTRVQWDPNGVAPVQVTTCATQKVAVANGQVRWTCVPNTDETVSGEHFVSTFSLGVLRKSLEQDLAGVPIANSRDVAPRFTPPLSSVPALAAALGKYPMAQYLKVFMQFDQKFWDDAQLTISAFSRGRWIGEYATVWQNLDLPKFLPGSKLLFVTVLGERALDFLSRSPAQNKQDMVDVLNNMFGGERIQAAYGRPQLLSSDVKAFSYNDWANDTLTYGMYSNMRANVSWDEIEPTRQRYGNLIFTGEHSCFRYNGYTHGALLGGRRSARILLAERYGVPEADDIQSICDVLPYDNNPDYQGNVPPGQINKVTGNRKRQVANGGKGNDGQPGGHVVKPRGMYRDTQLTDEEIDAQFSEAGTTRIPPGQAKQ